MSIKATQRNATRNQSTVDYNLSNLWLFGNRYATGILVNNTGAELLAEDGILVVRNAGTFETAAVDFNTGLTAGQTMILAGLTFTSTGVTTPSELAAAFANLSAGQIMPSNPKGTYSGNLTGYSTSAVNPGDQVVFTAETVGNATNVVAGGTGTAPTITIVAGTAGVADGFSPATSTNLADIIGILKIDGIVPLANAGTINAYYGLKGDIDTTLLKLPLGVNLSTIVGNKALKDILTDLGFVLFNVIETSKYDN